jgi:queuine/archaeosine tRNA-ribosyltransferase
MGCNCKTYTCSKAYRKKINDLKARIRTLKVLDQDNTSTYIEFLSELKGCPNRNLYKEIKQHVNNEYSEYT